MRTLQRGIAALSEGIDQRPAAARNERTLRRLVCLSRVRTHLLERLALSAHARVHRDHSPTHMNSVSALVGDGLLVARVNVSSGCC
jgi:hypothetical protein